MTQFNGREGKVIRLLSISKTMGTDKVRCYRQLRLDIVEWTRQDNHTHTPPPCIVSQFIIKITITLVQVSLPLN